MGPNQGYATPVVNCMLFKLLVRSFLLYFMVYSVGFVIPNRELWIYIRRDDSPRPKHQACDVFARSIREKLISSSLRVSGLILWILLHSHTGFLQQTREPSQHPVTKDFISGSFPQHLHILRIEVHATALVHLPFL